MYPGLPPESNGLRVMRIRTKFDTELIISSSKFKINICVTIYSK